MRFVWALKHFLNFFNFPFLFSVPWLDTSSIRTLFWLFAPIRVDKIWFCWIVTDNRSTWSNTATPQVQYKFSKNYYQQFNTPKSRARISFWLNKPQYWPSTKHKNSTPSAESSTKILPVIVNLNFKYIISFVQQFKGLWQHILKNVKIKPKNRENKNQFW